MTEIHAQANVDDRIAREIDANPVSATVSEAEDGRWTLQLQRRLRHDPDRVWRMLTDPDRLSRWSPFVPDRVLDSVGPATARENPDDEALVADVLALDRPRELVHRWGTDVLRWTLEADGEGTLLSLHHTFPQRPEAGMFAAGWHIALGTLAALETDESVRRVVGEDAKAYGWARLRDRYEQVLAD